MTVVRLSAFCRIVGGGRLKLSGKQFVDDGYPAYGAGGMNGYLATKEFDQPGIVLSSIGARCGKCFLADGEWTSLANTQLIFPETSKVDIRFLWYQLDDEARWPRSGAAQPFIRPSDVKAHEVYLPPLEEQRRIVAVLDEAFAAIATATANAEKNFANARELFNRTLSSIFEGHNTRIGDQLELQRGFDITKKDQSSGTVPVVSSSGIKSHHSNSMAKGPGVVIGRKGTLGSAFYIEEDYWPHDTTLWVKDFKANNPKLVYYLFRCLDVKTLDSGTANPSLNRNLVHALKVGWPQLPQQTAIVARLNELEGLSACYSGDTRKKLNCSPH